MKTNISIHLDKSPRLNFDFGAKAQWIELVDNDAAVVTVFVPSADFSAIRRAVDAFNAVMDDAERQSLLAAE